MDADRARGLGAGTVPLIALPGALVAYLAFNSGGIFPVTTAFAALLVLAIAVLAIALAPSPLGALSPLGLCALVLLALFAIWTLASGQWSDAGARAEVSFDRALLYLAALALFACLGRTDVRLRWLLRTLFLATAAVALIGLLSRVAPGVWPTAPGLVNDRLAYPVTYWNTFGLLVSFAVLLAFHHAADEREPAWIRVGATASLAPLAAALLLTFSRGATAVAIIGLLVYAVAARPRGLPGAVLAAAPTVAVALLATHGADLVQDGTPLTPAALAQAHDLTWVFVACAATAALLRATTIFLDARLAAIVVSRRTARRAWLIAAGLALLALAGFLVAGGATKLHDGYEKFVDGSAVEASDGDKSARLLDLGNDGRKPLWEVAEDSFSARPLSGTGAGTFQLYWQREDGRPDRFYAYSLPLEVLAELGIVGALLLGATLAILLLAAAALIRGPNRAAGAAAFALIVAWGLHACVDIDWQTPAVSAPIFALGGFALARRVHPPDEEMLEKPFRSSWLEPIVSLSRTTLRPLLALACLALALLAGLGALGQAKATDAIAALGSRDCASARSDAEAAIEALDPGPRPYEVLAMCAARADKPRQAVRRAEEAIEHDPNGWEPRYVLALTRGSAGHDPRPQLRAARAASPRRDLLRLAAEEFRHAPAAERRRVARALPFAIE